MAETDLVGKGWKFPVTTSGGGGIALSSGHAEIDESIAIILETAPGERVMRPGFGCRVHELAFAPLNDATVGLAQHFITEALGWWEPRIDVTEVAVVPEASNPQAGLLVVSIQYTIRDTHDERSLVYPFYLIRDEG